MTEQKKNLEVTRGRIEEALEKGLVTENLVKDYDTEFFLVNLDKFLEVK